MGTFIVNTALCGHPLTDFLETFVEEGGRFRGVFQMMDINNEWKEWILTRYPFECESFITSLVVRNDLDSVFTVLESNGERLYASDILAALCYTCQQASKQKNAVDRKLISCIKSIMLNAPTKKLDIAQFTVIFNMIHNLFDGDLFEELSECLICEERDTSFMHELKVKLPPEKYAGALYSLARKSISFKKGSVMLKLMKRFKHPSATTYYSEKSAILDELCELKMVDVIKELYDSDGAHGFTRTEIKFITKYTGTFIDDDDNYI